MSIAHRYINTLLEQPDDGRLNTSIDIRHAILLKQVEDDVVNFLVKDLLSRRFTQRRSILRLVAGDSPVVSTLRYNNRIVRTYAFAYIDYTKIVSQYGGETEHPETFKNVVIKAIGDLLYAKLQDALEQSDDLSQWSIIRKRNYPDVLRYVPSMWPVMVRDYADGKVFVAFTLEHSVDKKPERINLVVFIHPRGEF